MNGVEAYTDILLSNDEDEHLAPQRGGVHRAEEADEIEMHLVTFCHTDRNKAAALGDRLLRGLWQYFPGFAGFTGLPNIYDTPAGVELVQGPHAFYEYLKNLESTKVSVSTKDEEPNDPAVILRQLPDGLSDDEKLEQLFAGLTDPPDTIEDQDRITTLTRHGHLPGGYRGTSITAKAREAWEQHLSPYDWIPKKWSGWPPGVNHYGILEPARGGKMASPRHSRGRKNHARMEAEGWFHTAASTTAPAAGANTSCTALCGITPRMCCVTSGQSSSPEMMCCTSFIQQAIPCFFATPDPAFAVS